MSQEQSVWRLSELGKGPTALKLHREPVASPGPGQYLVRIHSVSLNYRDIAIANGTYGVPGIEAGIVLCADMAGEIVTVGEVSVYSKGATDHACLNSNLAIISARPNSASATKSPLSSTNSTSTVLQVPVVRR